MKKLLKPACLEKGSLWLFPLLLVPNPLLSRFGWLKSPCLLLSGRYHIFIPVLFLFPRLLSARNYAFEYTSQYSSVRSRRNNSIEIEIFPREYPTNRYDERTKKKKRGLLPPKKRLKILWEDSGSACYARDVHFIRVECNLPEWFWLSYDGFVNFFFAYLPLPRPLCVNCESSWWWAGK